MHFYTVVRHDFVSAVFCTEVENRVEFNSEFGMSKIYINKSIFSDIRTHGEIHYDGRERKR